MKIKTWVDLWVGTQNASETRMDTSFVAEGVRFELTEDFHPRQFSRLVHSTALPTFLRSPNYT